MREPVDLKPRLSQEHERAMTLFEVGVVVAVVMILAILLVPAVLHYRHRAPSRSAEMVCLINLKQIGLAYRIWASDHGDIFPAGVSIANGGSKEMAATGNVVSTFLVMSSAGV
jgi:type II secretory pathway pseudopilin PulG